MCFAFETFPASKKENYFRNKLDKLLGEKRGVKSPQTSIFYFICLFLFFVFL